jgi:serine/threonine protein kinase
MDWNISDAELTTTIREVGAGRFGSVRLTRWRGSIVAVKTFRTPDEENEKQMLLELLMKEFHTMIRLHHPAIVQTLGYVDNPFGIVMEYVEGSDLETLVLGHGRLPSSVRLKIMRELLCAIAYIHERKPEMVIHRDIKPSNILIQEPGHRVKLGDFGVSRFVMDAPRVASSTSLSSLGGSSGIVTSPLTHNVGTLRYMAPEIYGTGDNSPGPIYGHKVDLWSTAMVFYLLWEKKRPLPQGYTEDMSVVTFQTLLCQGMRPLWRRTPPIIRHLIRKGWRLNPMRRPDAIVWLAMVEQIPTQHCFDFWNCLIP